MQPVEGYFIQSKDGLILDVKGVEHIPGWVIAYVRYVPYFGTRIDESIRENSINALKYKKYYSFSDRKNILKKYPGHFFTFSGIEFQGSRLSDIQNIYHPEKRANEIIETKMELNHFYNDLKDFLTIIREKTGVQSPGVTGSGLVGLSHSSSDIDLVIYGELEARRMYRKMQDVFEEESVERYSKRTIRSLYDFRRKDSHYADFESFYKLEKNKPLQGLYKKRKQGNVDFYIRLVKHKRSIPMKPFLRWGKMEITARISDDLESIFTPCRYGIKDVEINEKPLDCEMVPSELISYRGRFTDVARRGNLVHARGTVETTLNENGEKTEYSRLVLGGDFTDILVPIDEN